ncbi:molybdopterin synthase sulfur carrier subunit-like [Pseudophryne corroboree]|uniref:molybdopterin synthase sulfur carrier subunit-like n=1 Tax=Pseudophryne corroboree TaxID=495146 RepID=UPI003081B571
MSCEVVVLYFAKSCELAGARSENIIVPQQITSRQLWEKIADLHPRLHVLEDNIVFAVCQEYVPIGDEVLTLHPGDEVAVIPPISGG